MKIGFNLLLWTGFVEEEHHGLLDSLKKTGYDSTLKYNFGRSKGNYVLIRDAVKYIDNHK